jgi:hypothetical protein
MAAEPLSLGLTLSVVSCSMKIATQKRGVEFKISLDHHLVIIGF